MDGDTKNAPAHKIPFSDGTFWFSIFNHQKEVAILDLRTKAKVTIRSFRRSRYKSTTSPIDEGQRQGKDLSFSFLVFFVLFFVFKVVSQKGSSHYNEDWGIPLKMFSILMCTLLTQKKPFPLCLRVPFMHGLHQWVFDFHSTCLRWSTRSFLFPEIHVFYPLNCLDAPLSKYPPKEAVNKEMLEKFGTKTYSKLFPPWFSQESWELLM